MTRLVNSRRAAALTFAALLSGAGSTAFADGAVELRMASLAPTGSRWEKTLSEGAAKVAKTTEDRVKVTYLFDGAAGDEFEMVSKLEAGGLDGVAVTSVGLAKIDKSIRVLELPMMFESPEEMDYVIKKMWKSFQKKFAKKGYQLGDAGEVGPIHFLSKNEVKSLSDLKNQKVWRWGDDAVVEAMYDELGLTGVPLGVPEVEANLTGGKINACYGPPLAAMTLGWSPPTVKYMTSLSMSYAIGATLIKLDSWNKISKDDQKAIGKITKKTSKTLKKAVRKDNKESEKQLKRKGITITTTPPEMVTAFQTAAEKVWQSLVGKLYTQKDLDKVIKYRDEYRAKNKK